MENITLTENKDPIPSQQTEVRLAEVEVKDENIALNVMVGFLVYAQKKGVFSLDESAKIWECIKMFQRPPPNST
jgi:hypothetical protein